MFDVLSKGFQSARRKLQGKALLTEENVSEALREVRTSLIQADVEFGVVKDFIARVKKRALGAEVAIKAKGGFEVGPQDHFVLACYEELVELMGPVDTELNLDGTPAVLMMVGLQGSGKTTTTGKLAMRLLAQGKKPMLVAADIYRPAAIEQLMVLGRRLDVPVFSIQGMKPVELAQMAVKQAASVGRDVVIIDTAGRLAIDNELMNELVQMKKAVKPSDILFVCDAMMGQDAVKTADAFDDLLDFTGFIMTKLDGDARGGAALSIKAVTGKPVKFLGQGEELDRLEEFRPEGLAQRILGMGDVIGLMKDFEKHVDQETAQVDAKKLLEGKFTYDDFVRQIKSVRRMGPLKELFARLPGVSQLMDQIPEEAFDDRQMDQTLAIIDSMTRQERKLPDLLDASRFERIARGCGRSVKDVGDLHDRFIQARAMMASFGNLASNPSALAQAQAMMGGQGGGFPGMGGMGGGMGGFANMLQGLQPKAPAKEQVVLSAEEKIERHKKQLEARKARKRGR